MSDDQPEDNWTRCLRIATVFRRACGRRRCFVTGDDTTDAHLNLLLADRGSALAIDPAPDGEWSCCTVIAEWTGWVPMRFVSREGWLGAVVEAVVTRRRHLRGMRRVMDIVEAARSRAEVEV